jgi:hypothetical protein
MFYMKNMFNCVRGDLFTVQCSLFSYAHCAVRDDCVQLLRGDLFSHEEGAILMFSIDKKMRAHLCFVLFLYV